MPQARSLTPALLERNLRSTFGQEYKRYEAEYREIFNAVTSNTAQDRYQHITGLPSWPQGYELQTATLEEMRSGGQKVLVNKEYKMGIIVSKSQMEDNLYKDMFKMTQLLGRGGRETVEINAAAVYNNAFASETSADGQYVCDTGHPLYDGTGGTQSNAQTAAALSFTSFWTMVTAASTLTDTMGLTVNLTMGRMVLVVPPALEKVAADLYYNQNVGGTANRDVNTLNKTRRWTYSVNHYLTSTTAWFIYFPDVMDGMTFQWRINPQFNSDVQFSQGTRFEGRERFAAGCPEWLGVNGNAGA